MGSLFTTGGGHVRLLRISKQGRKALLFLAPTIALLLFFFIWPVLLSFYYSFTDMTLSGSKSTNYNFIGFNHFVRMFSDPLFRTSFANTLIFLIFSAIIGQLILGFFIALLMRNKNRHFRSFVGMTILVGWIMPEIVCSFCWVAFFSKSGTLNTALTSLGILSKPISWLVSFPMVSVIIANIWHGTAFSMLQFQAALDDIPADVEASAAIDGANRWQKITRIIIPMIKGTIMTDAILITLKTLGVFGLIYAMTGGGPGTKTTTLSIYMYRQAFGSYQMGYGTAIAMVMLILGIVLSACYVKFSKIKL
ncbi:MAG: sugar ABC transporter permease [Clostridiaceae bacterium]|nr:sugar ABC transporter permease [Clostridiaceae bacterium]